MFERTNLYLFCLFFAAHPFSDVLIRHSHRWDDPKVTPKVNQHCNKLIIRKLLFTHITVYYLHINVCQSYVLYAEATADDGIDIVTSSLHT